jgi:hypothetical protein
VPNVHANLWVLYEGKLGQDGFLVASKVRILPTDHPKVKSENAPGDSSKPSATSQPLASGVEAAKDNAQRPNSTSSQTEVQEVDRMRETEVYGDTYRISKDPALQSRVRRVGMSLVPTSQNQLPEDDPSRIPFDFIAVDDPAHGIHASPDSDGLILIPAPLAARFKNDDQLAAVLADGVAFGLQQEAPRVFELNQAALTRAAVMGAANLVPFGGLAAGSVYYLEHERVLHEQRWRVALQLMADAGYDPWQAPEAWRLAEPGKLPADTSTLKYPDRSGYQFALLNLMYKKAAPTNASEGGSTQSDADRRK